MLFALPSTAAAYAARTVATAVVSVISAITYRKLNFPSPKCGRTASLPTALALGLPAGALVCAMWISLPSWPFAEPPPSDTSPYAPPVCGWALTLTRLIGSAFVIAPVEEYFFRSFLYRRLIARDFLAIPSTRFDLQAFVWTVLIFTLEHDRPLAAALTGAIYGALAIRFGLASAITAHITTNLMLGLHVIFRNAWQFW